MLSLSLKQDTGVRKNKLNLKGKALLFFRPHRQIFFIVLSKKPLIFYTFVRKQDFISDAILLLKCFKCILI